MYQYDDPTTIAVLPAATAAGTAGYFTDGSPAGGQPATILKAEFMNMVMMELINTIISAGITPSKSTYTQLRDAIKVVAGERAGHTYTANDWAWIDKSSGLIVQWGSVSMVVPDTAMSSISSAFSFPTAFPNALFCITGNPCQGGPFSGSDYTDAQECTYGFSFTGPAPYSGGTIRAMRIYGVSAGSPTSFPYIAIGR